MKCATFEHASKLDVAQSLMWLEYVSNAEKADAGSGVGGKTDLNGMGGTDKCGASPQRSQAIVLYLRPLVCFQDLLSPQFLQIRCLGSECHCFQVF